MLHSIPHFTLHVRLTRDCNAHCTYCSSAGAQNGRMTPEQFQSSIQWIADVLFPKIGVGQRHHLTIEYLGGEVLLVPSEELAQNVETARRILGQKVKKIRDGAQSNLIASKDKIDKLVRIFDRSIGTSWDTKTGQRHIHGNSELYNAILNRSLSHLKSEHALLPGRVIVVDEKTGPFVCEEIEQAAKEGYDLVLRPAFQGGSDDVAFAAVDALKNIYKRAYETWVATDRCVRVEPFSTLEQRRRQETQNVVSTGGQGCPFQSDCAFKSLSLDPDGSLYICQEMADSGHFPLGNALEQRFEAQTWKRLATRQSHLDTSCQKCPWLKSCGGGCMNEAIAKSGNPFEKTELCPVWITIFKEIDAHIKHERPQPHF